MLLVVMVVVMVIVIVLIMIVVLENAATFPVIAVSEIKQVFQEIHFSLHA